MCALCWIVLDWPFVGVGRVLGFVSWILAKTLVSAPLNPEFDRFGGYCRLKTEVPHMTTMNEITILSPFDILHSTLLNCVMTWSLRTVTQNESTFVQTQMGTFKKNIDDWNCFGHISEQASMEDGGLSLVCWDPSRTNQSRKQARNSFESEPTRQMPRLFMSPDREIVWRLYTPAEVQQQTQGRADRQARAGQWIGQR